MGGEGWFGIGWAWWILYIEIPVVLYLTLHIVSFFGDNTNRALWEISDRVAGSNELLYELRDKVEEIEEKLEGQEEGEKPWE